MPTKFLHKYEYTMATRAETTNRKSSLKVHNTQRKVR